MWQDNNEYDGEWQTGKMHGQGTFVWSSGERYDGEWQAGR
jgi:1-phosphatidylinositol-4-phosphate 5-kinase